jgi:hypothetical protein
MDYDIPGKDILVHYPASYTKVGKTIKVEIPGIFSDIDKRKLVQLGWRFNNPHSIVFIQKKR